MPANKPPTVIKKYANRRLYHMGTSTYVTLEDLAKMVRAGEDFVVSDAKSGEDITRAVLAQIIFEQENKQGQNLLPTTFLRQLIRFYGDNLQALVPRYLEFSMNSLTKDQSKLRAQMEKTFAPAAYNVMEDQVRANMAFFTEAMRMWTPFTPSGPPVPPDPTAQGQDEAAPPNRELERLRQQMDEMQQKLDGLTRERASSDK
ncbi:polyhydroxyalkanoate synthesis repressor PhaR [Enterovirga sp.]|jgi:polyhydroxyalkanoate synthesis repressor PhaR|uniref:polyhydroxyalkanoate synthesis repressor PhaR n=1 Tax=Enterovirga sp. TaxID=2026350 RepID=UPI0026229929|nr:polyhydroxyalkanoate synthesis repressor PhaR [Enterovirga sp.]MDB5592061.1 polyhydroxyalkonate synthesis repressor, PhaR [Enterovirga sp.]